MRHLDRDSVAAPPCLARYRHGEHQWDDLTAPHRAEVRAHLERLQGRRCAYCEGSLDALGHHVEHLRCRDRHPKRTFDWGNLYWSCTQDDSCGRYKDHQAAPYNVDDLIDPCDDDPDHFFRFRSDGSIDLAPGLSAREQHRARETLRVFNLNPAHGRLRVMRKLVADAYNQQEPNILRTLMDFDEDTRQAFILGELQRAEESFFGSVIRHLCLGGH